MYAAIANVWSSQKSVIGVQYAFSSVEKEVTSDNSDILHRPKNSV
jgi:hypothetical protein